MPNDAAPKVSSTVDPTVQGSPHATGDGLGKVVELDPAGLGRTLRAAIAGGEAAKLLQASVSLFHAGGRKVLSESAQGVVRKAAELSASRALSAAATPFFGPVAALGVKPMAQVVTRDAALAVGKSAARVAAKEVIRGVGKASGIGAMVDGAVAGLEAAVAMREGTADKTSAAIHVATEAATGAVATGAGVLLGVGLVALTGGVAAPVVFAVGAVGSIGSKKLLRKVLGPSRLKARAVTVRTISGDAEGTT